MKKNKFIPMGLQYGLHKNQIEDVICSVLDISSKEFFLIEEIDVKYIYDIQEAFFKIAKGEPEEYIYKKTEFWSNEFYVDSRVLIPRNDTEVLVDEAIKELSRNVDVETTTMIDVGTGSSCILISIIKAITPLKFKNVYALDISHEALEVSAINIENYNLKEQITQIQGFLFDNLLACDDIQLEKNIFITANLPYIKDGDHKNMDASVVKYEPNTALYGGKETGFELYEKLIKQCFQLKNILKISSITLFIEIGFDQQEVSKEFLGELGLKFEYFQDTHRIPRVIKITNF